ncbi:hypothetical protein LINPERHAP2_LOCUS35667 [Linum perenne]
MPPTSKVLSVSTDGNLHPGMFNLFARIFAHELTTNRVRTLQLTIGWNRLVEPILPGLTELCDSVGNLELSCHDDFYKPWKANFSALKTLLLY